MSLAGTESGATIWADGPVSSPTQPDKAQIRKWATVIEAVISAGLSNGGLVYDTKANLDADLAHPANSSAWVISDGTFANDGIYRKSGGSGSGSWTRIGDLPYSYIKATNAGAGTANAIIATTSIPIPAADGAALIALPITADNTNSPVTIAFNDGSVLTIKTSSGNDVVAGGLTSGMIVAGYVSGSTFRMLSDQAAAAIQAAAEAAASVAAASKTAAATSETNAATSATAAAASAASVDADSLANKVATRTAMKGLSGATFPAVYLYEAGREGVFNWGLADLSAFVAADTQEGIYVAPTSDTTGASGAWVRQHDGILRPEWFGAVAETDFGTPSTDSTAALAGWVSLVNALPLPTRLTAIYRSTAALAFTAAAVCIEGSDASDHGFLFSGCNGLEITQSSIYDMVQLRRLALLTDEANLYTGVKYTGATAYGIQAIKTYEEVWSIGLEGYGIRRFGNSGNGSQGWLKDYDIDDGDRSYLVRCSSEGPGNDVLDVSFFPIETRFVVANDCTHFKLIDCHCYFKETAVLVTGQAENLVISDGAYVANRKGVTLSGLVNPANDHNIRNAHFASFDYNIDICSDQSNPPLMVNIEGNLLFTRSAEGPFGPVADGFTHIKLYAERALIRGNYFYTDGTIDAVAGNHINVDVIDGDENLIVGNTGDRSNIFVNVRSAAHNTYIAGNTTEDNSTTLAVNPVVDGGDNTMYGPNSGDRCDLWPATIKTYAAHKLWGTAGTQILIGSTGAVGLSVTNVAGSPVNYVDFIPAATGSPPQVRALGADTNINLVLAPKGAGVVNSPSPIQGSRFQVAGTKVVGAQETGWTAGTGTANKGAFATYAGQTHGASYSQTAVQALDNIAKANSQRIKALEDMLRTHGLMN